MKTPVFIFILVFLKSFTLAQLAPTEDNTKSDRSNRVLELTSQNFDSSVSDGNAWLIEFYAPWCGHCTRFSPTYKEIAAEIHDINKSHESRKIMVGKVDGSIEKSLSSRFSIKGFPAFFLVEGWKVREYKGSRSKEAIIKFVTKTYKDVEAINFLYSPFGPMGQARNIMMVVGKNIIDSYQIMIDKGYSPAFSAILIGSVGITIGIISIVTIGFMTLPKLKED